MSEYVKANPHSQQPVNDTQTQGLESESKGSSLGHSREGNTLQRMANSSHMVRQLMAFQATANASRQVSQLKSLQLAANNGPAQRQATTSSRANLPHQLKAGIEELSGVSMEGVNVHMNSNMPAQMQAYAYAQGSDIHIAPGQEKHLPHEAWHVAQQRQGRVQATTQIGGSPVNDSQSLESEADTMGAKAMQLKLSDTPVQRKKSSNGSDVVQRAPFEFNFHPIFDIEGTGLVNKNWEDLQKILRKYNFLDSIDIEGRQEVLPLISQAILHWRTENNIFSTPWNQLSGNRQQKETALRGLEGDLKREWEEILNLQGLDLETTGNLNVPPSQETKNEPTLSKIVKGTEYWGFFKAGAQLRKANMALIEAPEEGTMCKLFEDGTAPAGRFAGDYFKVMELEKSIAKSMGTHTSISNGIIMKDPVWVKRDQVVKTNKVSSVDHAVHYEDRSNPVDHPLFAEPPRKEHIEQNALGDCYLMAAMMAIVDAYPNHFQDNMKDNFDGTVTVRLYDVTEGNVPAFAPRLVTVKKSVVKMNNSELDAFGGGALWVSILEKAYAAAGFHGRGSETLNVHTSSYGTLESGQAGYAMEHILGYRAQGRAFNEYVPGEDQDRTWDYTRLFSNEVGDSKIPGLSDRDIVHVVGFMDRHQREALRVFDRNTQPRREEFDALIELLPERPEELEDRFQIFVDWARTNLFPGKRGSGKYTPWQEQIFIDIATQVGAHMAVVVGTKEKVVSGGGNGGNSGENVGKGLAGPHGYSVIDFHPKPLNVPFAPDQLLWLKLRNPWGRNQDRREGGASPGRVYRDKTTDEVLDTPYDQPRTHGDDQELNGLGAEGTDNPEFWLELSDLTKRFTRFDYA